MATSKTIKDEMWLIPPPEVTVKLGTPDAMTAVKRSVMPVLLKYLTSQETEHIAILLRVVDIRVLQNLTELSQVPIYHDCAECWNSRFEASEWLQTNPGSAMILLMFRYDEIPR